MEPHKAIVRWYLERIEGVTRTWFEWGITPECLTKTLVVEVDFQTDPNLPGFGRSTLDAIEGTFRDVLEKETTMAVHDLRIVPKGVYWPGGA